MANVNDVAKFFIDLAQGQEQAQTGDLVTNLRLQKLLYFAQGWYLARYGKPLFDSPIKAWDLGPVVPEVYHAYKDNRANGISIDARISSEAFTEDELNLLLDVAREYDKYSTSALVDMTHQPNTPWAQAARPGDITTDSIRTFFAAQQPLRSFDDILSQMEVVVPKRDENGVAVFPADFDDDWGDYDAG